MKIRCFVDVDGHIWSINEAGESNFPADIAIDGDVVQVLGERDDQGPGRLVEDEYVLWPSLTALAIALEQEPEPSSDGSVSLQQAVAEAHQRAQSFEVWWVQANKDKPDHYPMSLPMDNAGLWHEQLCDHHLEDS